MRVQLIARVLVATGLVLLLSGPARAQTQFIGKLQIYVDDDHTEVYSPMVHAAADVTTSTNVSASYVADVVSSASVDIVSQASKTTIHDVRHQVSLGLTRTLDKLVLSGGYTFSMENDYLSNSVSAGAQFLLNGKNTTLSVGGSGAFNRVGRKGDFNYHRPLDVFGVTLSLTQIFSPVLIGQLTYEAQIADGFQASPYRFVPVNADDPMEPSFWVPETDPDRRYRHSVVLGVNRFVGENSALQADYRLYMDTWGIDSHTVEARWIVGFGDDAELRLRARTYVQGGASFYQASYHELKQYMTIDRELSPLWSETLGAKLIVKLGKNLEGELKLDGFYYSYPDFPLLPSRLGANVGIGLQIVY